MVKKYKKLNIYISLILLILVLANGWIFYKYQPLIFSKKEKATNNEIERNKEIGIREPTQTSNVKNTSTKKETDSSQNSTSSEKKDLPQQFRLSVPFTPQAPTANWDQPYQDACEEAGVLMLDAYYKDYDISPIFAEDEIKKMVAWEEKQGWGTSISINNISKLANHYMGSVSTQIIKDPTVKQIKTELYNENPVLVVAHGKELPNPYYSGEGPDYHVLVITGYTEDEFITNDPGTKRGENFKYSYESMMNGIHDWNQGKVKRGGKKVLIIE